jgi:hypothetical protein
MNDYMQRFKNTFKKIQDSSLYDNVENFHINVVTKTSNEFEYVQSILSQNKFKFYNICETLSGEMDTLKLLHRICKQQLCNKPVLYLHIKGVSRVGNANVQAWVDYMEYFAISKWKECTLKLNEYDTCGVNLQNKPSLHYSGNFWWANSSYISKLREFNEAVCSWRAPHYGSVDRAYCEFWLLDNDFCNPCTMHNSNVDHYGAHYSEGKYKF